MKLDVDAILFDIDGTLVDSTAVIERTWRIWAGRHGVEVQEVLAACHGRRTEDTVALFLPASERQAGTDELEALESNDFDGVVGLPGTQTLLHALPPARWAAVTSGSRDLMRARLRVSGLPLPTHMVASEDVAVGKPDPQGYLSAAAALRVDIQKCLVVEDAPAGVEAGRAAGAQTLAVCTSHSAANLSAADAVIPDLTALSVVVCGDALRVSIKSA